MSDWQLLREYAQKRSEAAFAELVKKHMNLVYGTCRRSLGDAQVAEDATQAVFLLLAQKAGSLGRGVSISGWLFTAARLVSRNMARGERRRHQHEEEAVQGMDHRSLPEPSWQEIEPWLNDAIAILTPGEREVILMRYFDDLSYREIASEMGTAENSAGKRARYAIDKMRRYLMKKGIVVSSAVLASLLASDRSHAAPPSCHTATLQAIHHLTIGQTTAGGSHLALLHKGVYITMQASKYKYLLVSVLALLIVGMVIPLAMHFHPSRAHAAEIGSVTLTDAEAGPLRANNADSTARIEIERDIAAETNDQEHNQWRTEPWDVANRVIIEGDHSQHNANDMLYATMNNFGMRLDHFAKDRTATIQVISFQLNGNRATVTSQFTERFVEKVQDPHFNDNKPVGSVFTGGGIEQSTWQNIGGRWMDVGPDSIPSTVRS